jgi:PAS domain S-box-containing protein
LTDGRQLVTHEDITELKRAEEAIRESEERFRGIFENTTIGLYRTNPDGRVLMANPALLHMLGYSCFKELAQRNLEKEGYEPNYTRSTFKQRIESEGQVIGLESAWQKRDGTTLFVRESARVIRDEADNVQYYEGTVEDITERKRAEEALRESEERLRLLSSHLLTAQETERRRISIELHDELGQALIALKHRLRSVEKKLPEDQTTLREECESALKYVDQVIEDVRRLSRDLKPSLLEELGLSAALQRLLDDFAKHFRIETSIGGTYIDTLFSREAQIIVYRIFQEALTNIAKHAEATHVSIVARKQDQCVSFLVEDNGRGFDVKRAAIRNPTGRGLGLTAMEERALMLGGSLDISSQEGTGTRISFTIPIRSDGS